MKKQCILLLWLLTCYTGLLQAQKITNYQFSAYQGTFTPLINATSIPGLSADSKYTNGLPIGFTFNYVGKTYDKFAISSNGFMTLGLGITSLNGSYQVNSLRDGIGGRRPIIAPLWDDLNMFNGLVSYKTEGTAGSRILTVEWLNAQWDYSSSVVISFQVKLYEADGKIEFIYRRESGSLRSPDASIGITNENTGVQSFLSLQNTSSSPTISSLVEENDISARPTSGQVYAFAPPPPFVITSFSPAQGNEGTAVTIQGSGFSATASNNEVKFNGVKATITSATTTELKVTVPSGATTGKITIDVNSETATSSNDFIVVAPPTITSFTPNQGSIRSTVTISGNNFNPTIANNTVKFNGKTATVNSATTTELQVMVPVGATTGKITVEASNGTATSATDFTVVLSANAPKITSFTPTSGLAGTNVVISGSNFSTTAANNTVKFNGTTATVNSATATELQVTVPVGATTGKITVEVNDETATSTNDFILPPTITSFTPARGLEGANVTISGNNFSTTATSNTVKFNGTEAVVASSTTTELRVKVPSGATTGKITVETNGETATSATDFTVVFPATITSFTPNQGAIRSQVTIKGTNFSATAADNTVKFNGKTATVTSAKDTELQVTVPVGATTGKITVEVNGGTATSSTDFTVVLSANAPKITSFSPASGSIGIEVTIKGTNFSATASNNTVKFNGSKAQVTSATTTELKVTVPALASDGKITVEVNDETAVSTNQFDVVPPPPTITSFTPKQATVGTTVTIEGTNFNRLNKVKFNGVEATIIRSTRTSIRTTVPTGATTGKITVEASGNTVTSATDFVVTSSSPTITGFTPDRGGEGASVTITGTNFSSNTLANVVKFNGALATIISATATEIKTSVPLGATTGKITVEVNFETATSATDFTVSTSEVTALPQNLQEAELILFPNPFSNNLTVEIKGKLKHSQLEVVVFNSQGEEVLVTKQVLVNGRLTLPLKKLAAGRYLIKISTGDGTILRRVIKL